jgi:hypothetical protein
VQHSCEQYKAELNVDGVIYKRLRVVVPRDGTKPLVATWGGIPLRWDIQANLEDQPQRRWNRRSEVEKRLLAQVCEQGGATFLTDRIEGHHIRALKDLTKYEGRQKPLWVPHHGGKTPKNAGPGSNVSSGPPRRTSTEATKIKLLNGTH